MRVQQVLQILQSSGHLAATIAPRSAAASSLTGVLEGSTLKQLTHALVAGQLRPLSTEVSSAASDQPASEIAQTATSATEAANASPAPAAPASARLPHRSGWVEWKESHLQEAGLFVSTAEWEALPPEQRAQLVRQQSSYLWKIRHQERLQERPASNMVIRVSSSGYQLEPVVAAISRRMSPKNRNAEPGGIDPRASSAAGGSSSSGSDDELSESPAVNRRARNTNSSSLRQRERWESAQAASTSWTESNINSEQDINYAAAAAEAAAAAANGEFNLKYLSQPQLDGQSLVKESTENLIVNLNTQLVRLAQAEQHERIVRLFDDLIERGMQAARQQQEQQQQQAQQQQDGQQQQEQAKETRAPVLVLPRQYRPDHSALVIYCRSLTWLAINLERKRRVHPGYDQFSPLAAKENRSSCIERAERAAALWASWSVARQTPGLQVHSALLTAYKAGSKPKKALEFFYMLRAANNADQLNHYRLHLTAVEAAIAAQNFPAADELARVFSSGIVAYKEMDYKMKLASIYRRLAVGAAASKQWEKGLHWLQMLIDNYMLVPVPADDFYNVMVHAAIAGRMDYVRLLITAADQHLQHQSGQPVKYTEDQLKLLIDAAARTRDVELVDTLWQRLLQDAAPPSSTTTSSSSSKKKQSSEPAKPRPSASAYQCVIRALVDCEQWSKALELVDEFDLAYGERHIGPGKNLSAVSVFDGLKSFPMSLDTESKVAAVFEALKARKDAGLPVTTCLMNIICRSIARLGNTEAAGTVFQSYGVWNITHDADSYNAIMECCEINKKVVGAESLISYMTNKGVKPNAATWNLLLSTAIRAGDRPTVVSAIERTMAAGQRVRRTLVKRAGDLAFYPPDEQLKAALDKVCKQQGLDSVLWAEASKYQRRQPDQNQPRRMGQLANADVWTPHHQQQHSGRKQTEQQQVMQEQPQQQVQQQQKQDQNNKPDSESGLRSQLRGAFGR